MISRFFCLSGILFLILCQNSKSQTVVKILDKVDQAPIVAAMVSICDQKYVTDDRGEIEIASNSFELCDIKISSFGYQQFSENIYLKNKSKLELYLDPVYQQLDEVEVSGGAIKLKSANDIVKEMLNLFEQNHIPDSVSQTFEESMKYQFGSQNVALRKSKGQIFFGSKLDMCEFKLTGSSYTVEVPETEDYLEKSLKNGGGSSQKFKEYGVGRSDKVYSEACTDLSTLECYLNQFYNIERIRLFNPVLNNRLDYQKMDHFGFLSPDFLDKHKFSQDGIEVVNGRKCFKIIISSSNSSPGISITGNSVKEWYKPDGVIWIDTDELAVVKLKYSYKMSLGIRKTVADKVEFNTGDSYFENVVDFAKIDGKFLPAKEFVKEKDRNLKIFYTKVDFEAGYVIRNIKYTY